MSHKHHISRSRFRFWIVVGALLSVVLASNQGSAEEQSPTTSEKANPKAVANSVQRAKSLQILENAQRQGFVLPDKVDRNDPSQRLLLLTPAEPIVIELRMKIDGQPYATAREEMVDKLLQAGNPSSEQLPAWQDVLSLPRLAGGRFLRLLDNAEDLKSTIASYDINGNGLAEATEIRLFLAQTYYGAAFGLIPNTFPPSIPSTSLIKLLDQNSDELLSGQELKDVQKRLSRRDIDDNEIIETSELVFPDNYNRMAVSAINSGPYAGVLLVIGEGADSSLIRKRILTRYAKGVDLTSDSVLALVPLINVLDRDKDGIVDDEEWKLVNEVPSQITLEVNFGSADGISPGISLVHMNEELGVTEDVLISQSENKLTLGLRGCHLELICEQSVPLGNYERTAQSIIDRFDRDKNGYLEKTELGEANQGFTAQFDLWDLNQDGKVYLEEIRSAYEEMQRPMWDRVLVGGVDLGKAIFEHLDINGDSSISLRESRLAEERLLKLDDNGNGQIESEELPVTIRVGIGRGTSVNQLLYSGAARNAGGFVSIGGASNPNNPAQLAKPRWFSGMDRNGDDDLSPREFLGTPEQFAEFDTDGDGLISRDEARSLKPDPKVASPGGGS